MGVCGGGGGRVCVGVCVGVRACVCVSSVCFKCVYVCLCVYVRLDAFHHRCIRTILAIPRSQQQSDRITSAQLRRHWGDPVPLSVKMRHRRLEWLGHVARMPEDRVPLQLLFGRLLAARPFCGPRRRWRDIVATDTKSIPNWFDCAQDRSAWREHVLVFQPPRAVEKSVLCSSCNRAFSRPQDRARHKCLAERQLPVHQQRGSAQCVSCCRWFRSKGGLAVHRCVVLSCRLVGLLVYFG